MNECVNDPWLILIAVMIGSYISGMIVMVALLTIGWNRGYRPQVWWSTPILLLGSWGVVVIMAMKSFDDSEVSEKDLMKLVGEEDS